MSADPIEEAIAAARAARAAAQADFLRAVMPSRETILAVLALAAFAVVAWVHAA